MTGPIIPKASHPRTVSDRSQINPTGGNGPALETSRSFQEMLAKAALTHSVPGAEPSANKAGGPVGNQAAATPEYTIRKGDTLSDVVAAALRKQGIRSSRGELYRAVNRVAAANGLANPNQIFPGQKIRLTGMNKPGAPTGSAPAQAPDFAAVSPALPEIEARVLHSPAHGRLSSRFGMRAHPVFGKEQPSSKGSGQATCLISFHNHPAKQAFSSFNPPFLPSKECSNSSVVKIYALTHS